MTEQWKELKETIIELRDNNGTCTQQEVCKFLANLMGILEKQMSCSEIPNNWIPVSERLPKDEQEILFSTKREECISENITMMIVLISGIHTGINAERGIML